MIYFLCENLINMIKRSIHEDILYIKNNIYNVKDLLIHIGIVIFTAVASAPPSAVEVVHSLQRYYDEGKLEGINRFWTVGIFIFSTLLQCL